MDLLLPDSGLLFWMTIVFAIVFVVLLFWGFPAIIKMVNDRKAFIDDSLQKAHMANEKLASIQEQQSVILKEAAGTRDTIIAQAEDKARAESARLISEAKAEIEIEKQNAIRDIRSQVAELSVLVAEKIVKEQLSSDAAQMDLVNRLLDEISVNQKSE